MNRHTTLLNFYMPPQKLNCSHWHSVSVCEQERFMNIQWIIIFHNREIDADLDHVLTIAAISDGIETDEDTHGLHKAVSPENRHAKKRSVVSRKVARKAAKSVMGIHLVMIAELNEMKNKKIVVGKKSQLEVGPRNLHENWNVFPRKNRVSVITMLRNESEQKIHRRENHQMTHQKRTWILRTLHKTLRKLNSTASQTISNSKQTQQPAE